MLNLIGYGLGATVHDAHELGRLLRYPSRRNRALPADTTPEDQTVGRRGGLRDQFDIYRDGAFFLRLYSSLGPYTILKAFEGGDPASHWVVL